MAAPDPGSDGERLMPLVGEQGWSSIHHYARDVGWSLDEVWKQPEGGDPEQEADSLWRSVALEKMCRDAMGETRVFDAGLLPLNRRLAPAEVRYDVETACRTIPRIIQLIFSSGELAVLNEVAWNREQSPTKATQERAPESLARWHEWLWDTTQVRGESEPEYWLSDLKVASSRLASGLEVVLSLDQRS